MKTVVVAGRRPVDENEVSIIRFLSFEHHPIFIIGHYRANIADCQGRMFGSQVGERSQKIQLQLLRNIDRSLQQSFVNQFAGT